MISFRVEDRVKPFVAEARAQYDGPIYVAPPPPPIPDEAHILANPGGFKDLAAERGVSPAPLRLKLWRLYCEVLREQVEAAGGPVLMSLPDRGLRCERIFQKGLLALGPNPRQFCLWGACYPPYPDGVFFADAGKDCSMSGQTPYSTLPDHCYWSRAHRVAAPRDVDPVISAGFKVTRKMKISTAGSCFAQHIARRLKADGFTFYAP